MNDVPAPNYPDVRMNIAPPTRPVVGRIVSNDSCMRGKSASFVRHTVIDVSGTPLEGAFSAGQAFGVIPPGTDGAGKSHKVRLYSLACPGYGEDGAGRLISTTPKRLIDELKPADADDPLTPYRLFLGVCSNYLCGLRPGDEVSLSGPNGKRFLLPVDRDAHDYLFIATGTGIAPFRGMARELLEHPAGAATARIHLISGSPYRSDLLYHDLFRSLAERHHNFSYEVAISREPDPQTGSGTYVYQRLERDLDRLGPLLAGERTLLYLCGIAGMEAGVFDVLERHGLAAGYFSAKSPDHEPGDPDHTLVHHAVRTTGRCMVEVY
jgi:ferredoxin--NADP+ reductase